MSLLVQYDHELQMRLGITSQTYVSKDDRIYYAGNKKKKINRLQKKEVMNEATKITLRIFHCCIFFNNLRTLVCGIP